MRQPDHRGGGQALAERALIEIVVPAFNEAARLPRGLRLLSEAIEQIGLDAEVLVVDNASTDETARIVRDWTGTVPVRLIRCARRGKGAAVRAGLLATTAPYVGFCDADMATELGALRQAAERLADGCQVVVGSRRHPSSVVIMNAGPLRRVGTLIFNRLSRDLAGGVGDTQCGFKFFSGPLARTAAAELRTAGFAFDAELLMHCVRRGAEIDALPIYWRDVEGSTFSVGRHSYSCVRDLLRIRRMARHQAPPRMDTKPLLSGLSRA